MRLPLPEGFQAPIQYNRLHKGYAYTDPRFSLAGVSLRSDELEAIEEAVDIIRSIGTSRMSDKFAHAIEKIRSVSIEKKDAPGNIPVLQTMQAPDAGVFEHFDVFYKACRDHYTVSFIHFSYTKRQFKHILLHPFLIKEFENRWYIIGFSEVHGGIRTFGFDRITGPMLVKKPYKPTHTETIKSYLHDVYGVFPIPKAKKEKVKIRVSQLATHYLQAYPIHPSQVIKKENAGDSTVTLFLVPSIELSRYFLSQGRHVRIISPKWLIDFTKNLAS